MRNGHIKASGERSNAGGVLQVCAIKRHVSAYACGNVVCRETQHGGTRVEPADTEASLLPRA